MSFLSKFKGKVALVGKDGSIPVHTPSPNHLSVISYKPNHNSHSQRVTKSKGAHQAITSIMQPTHSSQLQQSALNQLTPIIVTEVDACNLHTHKMAKPHRSSVDLFEGFSCQSKCSKNPSEQIGQCNFTNCLDLQRGDRCSRQMRSLSTIVYENTNLTHRSSNYEFKEKRAEVSRHKNLLCPPNIRRSTEDLSMMHFTVDNS